MGPTTCKRTSQNKGIPQSSRILLCKRVVSNKTDLEECDINTIYDRLINEAPYISVQDGNDIALSDLSWIDPVKVKSGQDFVARNFFSLICAHLGALLYGFSFKSLSTILLRTGKSSDVDVSLIRYLSTFIHLKTWYESNTTSDPTSEGYGDLRKVKRMHRLALKQYTALPLSSMEINQIQNEAKTLPRQAVMEAIQKDLSKIPSLEIPRNLITYHPQIPMSQFDMSITLFGFISLVYLFPSTLGIREEDDDGLNGFLHLWAIFGKVIGIEDKFNLALYPSRRLYTKIFLNIGIGSLRDLDLIVVQLQEVLIEGVRKYTYFTSHKSLLYFGLSRNRILTDLGYDGKQLRRQLKWKDIIYYWFMRLLLASVYESHGVRLLVNFTARKVLAMASTHYLNKRNHQKIQSNSIRSYCLINQKQKYIKYFSVENTLSLNFTQVLGIVSLILFSSFIFPIFKF